MRDGLWDTKFVIGITRDLAIGVGFGREIAVRLVGVGGSNAQLGDRR